LTIAPFCRRFHFSSLAHDNNAVTSAIQSIYFFPPSSPGDERSSGDADTEPTPAPAVLTGTQQIPKFNHENPDDVLIYMALYRIESKSVDLVVTMNVPMKTANLDATVVPGSDVVQAEYEDFMCLVRSLRIVDYGLFVPPPTPEVDDVQVDDTEEPPPDTMTTE
jgi:Ran-interacting Mog1 protein